MSEVIPTSASVGTQRVKLASSLEWKNLLTHFDLTGGEGFAFIVLLVADAEWAEACRLALERYLLIRKKKLQVVSFQNADEFKDELASRLLSLEPVPDTGAIWMAATVTEAEKDYESWAAAWRTGVARLNQYRNPLIRHFDVPLIFVGAPWIQTTLREMSPDLWSVRAIVVRIESLVSKVISTNDTSASATMVSSGTIDAEGRAIDPEFALREAAQLRGRIGSEPTLARLLYRAGIGFNALSRWAEGAEALHEAVEIYRRSPGSEANLALSLFNLSSNYFWQTNYAQATANLIEAQNLFREVGNALGEAHCIKSLGDIALRCSDHAAAAERFEQALSLFHQVGDLQGEGECIHRLGDVALRRSDHATAAQRYEQALTLFRQIGDVLGEANCIQSLGDVALRRSDHATAAQRYEQTLPLYREVGDTLGEANSIKSLGDIALERSDHATAAERFEQALLLYRKVGDLNGEANSINGLGHIALRRSNYIAAMRRYEEALLLFRQIGNVHGEANSINGLGHIALQHSDYVVAAQLYEQALSLFREVGDLHSEANCILMLGDIESKIGEKDEAAKLWMTGLDLYELMAEPYSIGMAHYRLARIAASDIDREQHIEAACAAWKSIDRPDLIARMEKEFTIQT